MAQMSPELPSSPKIVVASFNPGKLVEFQSLLSNIAQIVNLAEFDNITEVIEDGNSFAENSRKKAIGYARQTNCLAIADDSGLCVDALNGEPGIHSARFSNEPNLDRDALDIANVDKVLDLLKDTPDEKRTARFVCYLTLADSNQVLIETKGVLEGIITRQVIGDNGFGYDPIFYVTDFDCTTAELPPTKKNEISHRAKAVEKFAPLLIQLLKKKRLT